jgi:hypothetical protein
VVAGLVAGLLLTTLQALARLFLGVPPPAELLGDRVAPLLTIDQFFGLFATFGGDNGLEQAGILGGTAGQLVVGIAVAVAVASVARRSARRGRRLLAVLTSLLFLAAVAVGWPILSTNYAGSGPDTARLITLAVLAVAFGLFGVTVGVVLRLLGARASGAAPAPTREPASAGPEPAPIGRRALLAGGVGVVGVGLAAATAGTGAELYRRATFGYDGLRVGGPAPPRSPRARPSKR